MNCLRSRRTWATFLAAVHRGLEAAELERDFFGADDLMHLAKCGYTPDRVVAAAKDAAASDLRTRAQREAAHP